MSPGSTDPRIEQVRAAVDEEKLVDLALEMVSVASPLGDDDELARLLDGRLRALGLMSRLQPFAPGRSNVVATLDGTGGGRSLMLNANLENDLFPDAVTVPPAQVVDGEWISGPGIWNMKGAFAAAIAAVAAVRTAGITLPGDVVLAGVAAMMDEAPVETRISGESHLGYGAGTKHMLASGVAADMCVVGTPTSFKLVAQHFGTTAVRIDVTGKTFFSGAVEDFTGNLPFVPPAGTTCIEHAAEVVQALRAWMPDYERRNTVEGVRPYVRIAAIEGGLPWMPLPAADCSIFVFVGTPPRAGLQDVLGEVRSVLAALRERNPDVDARAELYSINPGPFVAEDEPIVAELRAAHASVFGAEPESAVVIWHSDASPLVRYGIPSVNYGPPGRFSGDEERVRVRDLVSCARVYAELIVRVCG